VHNLINPPDVLPFGICENKELEASFCVKQRPRAKRLQVLKLYEWSLNGPPGGIAEEFVSRCHFEKVLQNVSRILDNGKPQNSTHHSNVALIRNALLYQCFAKCHKAKLDGLQRHRETDRGVMKY
jgi:hypothetical protein